MGCSRIDSGKLDSKFTGHVAGSSCFDLPGASETFRTQGYSFTSLAPVVAWGGPESLPVSLAHHHRLGVYYHVVLRLDI